MELSLSGILIACFTILSVGFAQDISLQLSKNEPCAIGEDFTFHCRVDDFPPGGVVIWWKRQGQEEVILGKNNELQIPIDRYELLVKQVNTAVLFYLNIRGVQVEDNGEFGCSLASDPENIIYANLVVSDPVREIHLYRIREANSTEVVHEYGDGESFFFTAEDEYFFQCVASGSNPPPNMQFTIGYQDNLEVLNGKFVRTDKLISDPASGDVAFRRTNYAGIMTSTEVITVDWKANSQEFRCSASIANMDVPKSIHIKPIMKLAPIIECTESVEVPIWTSNVVFSCTVYADPPLQAIRWYWGNECRGTSLNAGEALGAFKFDLVEGEKPDMKIARLTIDMVFIQMYGKYHLAAKNEKGLSVHVLHLVRDTTNEPSYQVGRASLPRAISVILVLAVNLEMLLF